MTSIERTTPLLRTKASHRTCPAGRPPGPIRTTGHLASQLGAATETLAPRRRACADDRAVRERRQCRR